MTTRRWFVWCDDKPARVVSSRLQAKKLCAKTRETGYFCRGDIAVQGTATWLRLTDLVVWSMASDGTFWRSLYVVPESELSEGNRPFGVPLDAAALRRYAGALTNDRVWKLGPGSLVNSIRYYPIELGEVTLDSDDAMSCAGHECVGEYKSIRAYRRAEHSNRPPDDVLCATVHDGVLKLWVELEG